MSALLSKQLIISKLASDVQNVRIWDQLDVGGGQIAKGRADVIVEVAGGNNSSVPGVPATYTYTVLLEILVQFADVARNDDALTLVQAILDALEGWQPWDNSITTLCPSWRFVDKSEGRWIYSISTQMQGFLFGETYSAPAQIALPLQWHLSLGVWEQAARQNPPSSRLIAKLPKS